MRPLKHAAGLSVALVLMILLAIGCSRFDAPTASGSSEAEMGLWAPNPGDQIVPGRDVPILQPGYWEGLLGNGSAAEPANPALIPPRTMRIGPEGGTFGLGYHRLIIPPGAVSSTVMITLSNASVTAVALDCTPSPFRFNVPVTLVLSYRGTQYEAVANPPLQVIYMESEDGFIPLESVVDPVNLTVSASTDHFSRYIVG